MRRVIALAALVAAAAAWTAPARACNLCVEDKIAATYDWQLAQSAARVGHVIVFVELHGPMRDGDHALERELSRKVAAVPGVDRGSVRISLAPAAASFACAPGGQLPRRIVAAVSRAIAGRGLRASLIRVGAPGSIAEQAQAPR